MKDTTKIRVKEMGKKGLSIEKKPCLIMIEGDYLGEIYPLDKATCILGRDQDVDIILSDDGVSRRHATIEKKPEGFVLTDLKSTNGTEINGVTVQHAPLTDGDKIQLGTTVLKFCYQDDIDNEYHRQLRNLAIRDGLTRIYNKRYFLDALRKEFHYSQRHDVALSVLLFDIDHFKKLNDTYGHPAGDFVLKRLATILEKGIRGYDVFARYGGEEFVFLLRGLSHSAAIPFAERIRKLIDEACFTYENQQLAVTISVGLATNESSQRYETEEALVAAADASLYQAKQSGRNRVGVKVS